MNLFLIISIYSFLYGLYENNLVYRNLHLLEHLTTYGNWSIMFSLFFFILFYFRSDFIHVFYYILYFALFEDIIFWISDGINNNVYPFPVGNWYDDQFTFFYLFGLGKATSFFPYVPRFYYLFAVVCGVYLFFHKINNHKLKHIWSMLTLVPTFILIFGSIILPKEIILHYSFLLFAIILVVVYYIIFICYIIKFGIIRFDIIKFDIIKKICNYKTSNNISQHREIYL